MGSTSEHFSASELQCKGTNCGPSKTGCHVNNCTPDLTQALELFRAAAGSKPVLVHDAYRCRIHNAETSGAVTDSQHTLGNAADVSIEGMTAGQLEAIARTVPQIKGIGRNDEQGWIHIDVRPGLVLALWAYRGKSWCKYYPPVPATDQAA